MNLEFTIVEASDNSKLVITDITADYGANQIQDVYDNGYAVISLSVLGVNYDDIIVTSYFNGNDQNNLVFNITPEMLKISGEAQYEVDDSIPDGDYYINYSVDDGLGDSDSQLEYELIYGTVEFEILDEIRVINLPLTLKTESVYRAMIRGAWDTYLQGMINSAYIGEVENIRRNLSNLQIMIANGVY